MKKFTLIFLASFFIIMSCDNLLEEEVFAELAPGNFFNNAEDAEALLNATYSISQGYRDQLRDYLTFGEFTTDIAIQRAGAINTFIKPVEDFVWDATHPYLQYLWGRYFSAIFRANTVLDRVPGINMDEERKQQILAEARFLRAFNYFYLYDLFGPVPILVSSSGAVDDFPGRPAKDTFIEFLEDEFLAVSEILPAIQEQYPRATKGAALGFLCKFYLNNKKWQPAAETAKKIVDSKTYAVFAGDNRTELFAMENQMNSEYIFVSPFIPISDTGNTYLSHAAPPGYKFEFAPKVNFAAQFKILSAFINTFDPADERLDAFVFQYVNQAGATVVLGQDDVRSFKYPEDPAQTGDVSGNDYPLLRYADILLSRAEALNELSGPNPESIALINEVREAAGIAEHDLGDFVSKAQLRDAILAERGWEFHTEALRRQDLIRHGKFIEFARARGKAAADHHILFPIPQIEIDTNPELVQNEGYSW